MIVSYNYISGHFSDTPESKLLASTDNEGFLGKLRAFSTMKALIFFVK